MPTHVARTLTALVAAALVLLSGVGAEAKAGDVVRTGRCTASSTWKLKLKHDDGGIQSELEVDQNRNNVRWSVTMSDNSVRVFTGSAVTQAPSGSFEVRRLIPNRAGTDHVVARATNPATGEVCRATAAI